MAPILASLLTGNSLQDLAGDLTCVRGEEYFEEGRVWRLEASDDGIEARVRGTHDYRVRIWSERKRVCSACTCPAAEDGAFCKHAVAVALAFLADSTGPARKHRKPSLTKEDVKQHLWEMEKEDLVDLLMQQADYDERLSRQLFLLAAKQRKAGPDLATYRRSIDSAVATDGFVDYGHMHDYVRGIDEVVDQIEALLGVGAAEAVIELTEHALDGVEEAINSTDDSNGELHEVLERLQRLHHLACERARPDVEELAERLFSWELCSEFDVFHGAVRTYAEILGEKGLAAYRGLAEGVWAKVLPLGPGERDDEKYGKRFRITSIMESLAEMTGDLDEKIAVQSRDLSEAHDFLRVAEICKKAGREDLALQWAERGIEAFPSRTDWRLRGFVAEEYQRLGRRDEALALVWDAFVDAPHLPMYEELAAHAKSARCWPAFRERALAFLHTSIREENRQRKLDRWARPADHSDLVRIFLWEKDEGAAWAEAKAGGCTDELWVKLAGLREKDHPEDAVPIYRAQVESCLGRRNNEGYAQAIQWLDKVRRLSIRSSRSQEFERDLAELRATHKAKRNFAKLLDAKGWMPGQGAGTVRARERPRRP